MLPWLCMCEFWECGGEGNCGGVGGPTLSLARFVRRTRKHRTLTQSTHRASETGTSTRLCGNNNPFKCYVTRFKNYYGAVAAAAATDNDGDDDDARSWLRWPAVALTAKYTPFVWYRYMHLCMYTCLYMYKNVYCMDWILLSINNNNNYNNINVIYTPRRYHYELISKSDRIGSVARKHTSMYLCTHTKCIGVSFAPYSSWWVCRCCDQGNFIFFFCFFSL